MAYRDDVSEKIIWFDYSNRTKTDLQTYKGRFGLNGKCMSWNSNNSKNEVFLNFKKGERKGIKIDFKK